jgi:glycogen synthase
MRIVILTNEYPPHVYGGAGVHVEYLVKELVQLDDRAHDIQVLCFGEQCTQERNLRVEGVDPHFLPPAQDPHHQKFLETLVRDIVMAGSVAAADIVHAHTWYAHLAGCLLKSLLGSRLVLTTHSLEPHRPWKVEQLGSAYHASSWVERTAYQNADGVVAVSEAMQRDVRHLYGVSVDKTRVIHNGIDVHEYRPRPNPAVLQSYHIDPDQPFVLFVGRITRQKGIMHLINAIQFLQPGLQVVLCAGAPDTPELGQEMGERLEAARRDSPNTIIWVPEMVPRGHVIALYTQASIFICPSVYEPFGIINLEAMACETPVVASAVGGIPEVVVHGETGFLVPFEPVGAHDFEPKEPEQFSKNLAAAVNRLLDDATTRQEMSRKARRRVEEYFSWSSIARRTLEFYRDLTAA